MATGRRLSHRQEIGTLTLSRGGSLLAAGDQTGRAALRGGGRNERAGLPVSDAQDLEAVAARALSPDSRAPADGGGTGTLQLWGTATPQPIGGPPTPSGVMPSIP